MPKGCGPSLEPALHRPDSPPSRDFAFALDKDRLCCRGFDQFEHFAETHRGEIRVVNQPRLSPPSSVEPVVTWLPRLLKGVDHT